MLFSVIITILAISHTHAATAVANSKACSNIISTQLPSSHTPLYLRITKIVKQLALIEPTNGNLEVLKGEKLLLACPNKNNFIKETTKQIASTECDLSFHKKVKGITCSQSVRAHVVDTPRDCSVGGRDGKVHEIGFNIEYDGQKKRFLKLYKVCYDFETASALYAHHQINGKAIGGAMKERHSSYFYADKTPDDVNVRESYEKASQVARFKELLGSSKMYIDNAKFYMARGHLAPNADFVFSTHRAATFYFINVVPQFQSINNGNLKGVEAITVTLAIQEGTILEIYTAVYGQLILLDENDEEVPISLGADGKIPVPNWIFKIVYNPVAKTAIVFVISNNPFLGEDKYIPFCGDNDVCEAAGMHFKHDPHKGFTSCCEYKHFAKIVEFNKKLNVKKKDGLLKLASAV